MPDDAPRSTPVPPGEPAAQDDLQHAAAGAHAHGRHHGPRKPRHLKLVALVVLIAAMSSAAYGIVQRRNTDDALARWTDAQAVPTVAVAHPLSGAATRSLTLPGDVQAFYEAPIYARVSGYVQAWYKDIGAHVKAGQVLATIDTPDLDQQLAQAQADLATARANAALADLTFKRWHALLASNSVSQQSADEKEGNALAMRATVAAQQAHVDQLRALKGFARLTAPFDGVVTARNTDVGALINAGSSAVQPLFKVADVHAMRIYVRVPQVYASELAAGMQARLMQPQYPGKAFAATLATTSQSVAADSRTVLAELMAGNEDGKLWPGTYGEVRFDLPGDQGVLRVPASALIFRSHGPQVATLGPDNRLLLKSVVVGRNLGDQIEISSGISPADWVVTSPLDTLEDGETVRVAGRLGGTASSPPALLILCLVATSCDLAPKYQTPVTAVPVSYAEAAHWQRAAPADAVPRGEWWRIYEDPTLNTLEARVEGGNPDLAAEAALLDQSRALVAQAQAGLLPDIGIGAHISTNRQSTRRPLRGAHQPNQYLDNAIDTQATYEIDFWDKIANAVKAGKASAQATEADLQTLRLSLHAELATEYFALRGLDAQAALLARTVNTYQQALALTENRFAGKIASGIDVARAATQLDDAEAQASDIAARRALSVHAIAMLVGVPPSSLTIAAAPVRVRVPALDPGVPASLLERRPDVASAERLVASANAEIGVVRAAFYPNISLNLVLGLQDTGFNLFNLPDSFWSVGPGLTLPLFEGGLRTAEVDAARASYRQAVAAYKQTVIGAFGDVEDQLALVHFLGDEQRQEDAAAGNADKALTMAMALYKDGATDFLDVVTAQTAELQAERNALDIKTRRVAATVALIRALGGGWERTALAAVTRKNGNDS